MNQPIASKYLRRELPATLLDELKALLGAERVSVANAVREHHGHDESHFPDALPDVVVFPETTEEVASVVKACAKHKFPVIPYGTGTSLEGHILAIHGGVTVDVSRMNQVLAVHAEDLDAVVQAGVTRKALNAHIKDTGLFFPIDPGADASIGGMSATRASGTAAVRYGTMKENVLALTVVMAAPWSDDNSTRRSEFPSVVPKPRSRGSAVDTSAPERDSSVTCPSQVRVPLVSETLSSTGTRAWRRWFGERSTGSGSGRRGAAAISASTSASARARRSALTSTSSSTSLRATWRAVAVLPQPFGPSMTTAPVAARRAASSGSTMRGR